MSAVNQMEQKQKEKEIIMRAFDVCENTIKTWISNLMEISPKKLFDKYVFDGDTPLYFRHNDKIYEIKASIIDKDSVSENINDFKENPAAGEAVDGILGNIPKIFMAVVQTINKEHADDIYGYIPSFNAKHYRYQWCFIHPLLLDYKLRMHQIEKMEKSGTASALEIADLKESNEVLMMRIRKEQLMEMSGARTNELAESRPWCGIIISVVNPEAVSDLVKMKKLQQLLKDLPTSYESPEELDTRMSNLDL